MAKRKNERMSKEELRAPDQVEAFLNKWWERVTKHKKVILTAIGLFVAAGVAYTFYERAEEAKQEETATALRGVFDPLVSPIVPDEEAGTQMREGLGTNAYLDRKTQLEAALKGADAFIEGNAGAQAVNSVKFVKASARAVTGDPKAGAQELAAWLEENQESVLRFSAMIQLGVAQLASGQQDAAKTTFKKIHDDSPEGSLAQAMALTRLGDLSNPMMTESGNSAEALKSYEAAQKIVQDDRANPLSRELELKVAFLK